MTTLRTLECLLALDEHRSVSRAAAALYMSQPALSHQIASLERELGAPVAERLARGVRMTAAGRAAAVEAQIAVAAAERAIEVGRRVGQGRRWQDSGLVCRDDDRVAPVPGADAMAFAASQRSHRALRIHERRRGGQVSGGGTPRHRHRSSAHPYDGQGRRLRRRGSCRRTSRRSPFFEGSGGNCSYATWPENPSCTTTMKTTWLPGSTNSPTATGSSSILCCARTARAPQSSWPRLVSVPPSCRYRPWAPSHPG